MDKTTDILVRNVPKRVERTLRGVARQYKISRAEVCRAALYVYAARIWREQREHKLQRTLQAKAPSTQETPQ